MADKLLRRAVGELPPAPATAAMVAHAKGQTIERQQGRELLVGMECVVERVPMQRNNDLVRVEVLEAMRTPGGAISGRAGSQTERRAVARARASVLPAVAVLVSLACGADACKKQEAGMSVRMSGWVE